MSACTWTLGLSGAGSVTGLFFVLSFKVTILLDEVKLWLKSSIQMKAVQVNLLKPDTALICLMVALRLMGITVKEEEIRKECTLGVSDVMDTQNLIRAAKALKINAKIVSPKPEQLSEQLTPSIAILNNGNYVVAGKKTQFCMVCASVCPLQKIS